MATEVPVASLTTRKVFCPKGLSGSFSSPTDRTERDFEPVALSFSSLIELRSQRPFSLYFFKKSDFGLVNENYRPDNSYGPASPTSPFKASLRATLESWLTRTISQIVRTGQDSLLLILVKSD